MTTYRRIGAILHEIGMVSEETLRSVLEDFEAYANDELDHHEAAAALESFGVAVSVHSDRIGSIREGYASLLTSAVEVVGGGVTIGNVRLVEGEGELTDGRDDLLQFERNGSLVSIDAEHRADTYYDHEAACNAIAETAPDGDPRSWLYVDFEREPYRLDDSVMVLATPGQARALQEQLGFTLH